MLQEKRVDLDAEKQKRLLQALVAELSQTQGDLYYQSTSQIAVLLQRYINDQAQLTADDRALLQKLDRRDIEMMLSLH